MKTENTATIPASSITSNTAAISSAQYANDLLAIAIKANAPTEQINKLVEMRENVRVHEGRKKYLAALSGFQFDCPVLKKKTTVAIIGDKGGSRSYKYATLADITQEIKPILHKYGLSYRWEMALNDHTSDIITCSCIVSHIDGHYEETTISAEVDSSSEVKNKIQQRGSTISYLHRLTLISALGLSTGEEDETAHPTAPAKVSSGKIVDPPIGTKMPPVIDATHAPILPEDLEKIQKDIASFNTEKEVTDYYFSWEKKYGKSLVFRQMLRKKISLLPSDSRFTKEQKDTYKKPEKFVQYE